MAKRIVLVNAGVPHNKLWVCERARAQLSACADKNEGK